MSYQDYLEGQSDGETGYVSIRQHGNRDYEDGRIAGMQKRLSSSMPSSSSSNDSCAMVLLLMVLVVGVLLKMGGWFWNSLWK